MTKEKAFETMVKAKSFLWHHWYQITSKEEYKESFDLLWLLRFAIEQKHYSEVERKQVEGICDHLVNLRAAFYRKYLRPKFMTVEETNRLLDTRFHILTCDYPATPKESINNEEKVKYSTYDYNPNLLFKVETKHIKLYI